MLDGPVVSMATGSTFSALLTQHGSLYYCGRIGGLVEELKEEEEEEEEWETNRESVMTEKREGGVKVDDGKGRKVWRPLVVAGDRNRSGSVVEIKAGLHYLAALEIDEGLL